MSVTEQSNAQVLASFANIDHTRQARTGFPEAVFAEGKTPPQVAAILDDMTKHANDAESTTAVLATRYVRVRSVVPIGWELLVHECTGKMSNSTTHGILILVALLLYIFVAQSFAGNVPSDGFHSLYAR